MCPYLADKGEEMVEMLRGEPGSSCRQNGVDILHLHGVLVDLGLPDRGELIQRETDTQELHNGPQLVTVLGVVEVT